MYAHALIEDPRDGQIYNRGDEVPDDLPGIDELVAGGSVSEDQYPDEVQVRSGDSGSSVEGHE